MDDTLLVSRAIAGDLDSFGQLYDSYFGRVYDFTWRVLRDSDEAGKATLRTFVEAMRELPALASGSGFKAGLFAIAHREALERAASAPAVAPVHEEAFGTFDVPDPCRLDDPAVAAGDHEVAALVWEAASSLNARDYALLDLHVRQGLGAAEIATLIDVSKANAQTVVSRMKAAATGVISGYLVARRGSKDCPELQAVLANLEFPPYTEEVRKAVDAHIEGCETCQATRRRLPDPLAILGAFALVAPPAALKGDIWAELSGAWSRRGAGTPLRSGAGGALPPSPYGPLAAGVGGGGSLGGDFAAIAAGGEGWDRNRIMLFGAAAVGLLVFAFGAGALMLAAFGGGGGGGGGAKATRTPTAGAASPQPDVTVGVSVETPTPNLTPSVTPEPSPTEVPPTELPPTEAPTIAPTATRTPAPRGTPTRTFTPTRTPPGGKPPTPTPTP